jgi:hypothetical protein
MLWQSQCTTIQSTHQNTKDQEDMAAVPEVMVAVPEVMVAVPEDMVAISHHQDHQADMEDGKQARPFHLHWAFFNYCICLIRNFFSKSFLSFTKSSERAFRASEN